MSHLSALLVLLSLESANVVDLDSAVKEAQHRVNNAQRRIEQSLVQSKKLRQTVNAKTADGFSEQVQLPQMSPTEFQIKTAYHHDWKTGTKYQTRRDFDIYLDYSNQAHVSLIQKQYQEWLKRGYYVIRSESQDIVSDKITGTIQKVRIVK